MYKRAITLGVLSLCVAYLCGCNALQAGAASALKSRLGPSYRVEKGFDDFDNARTIMMVGNGQATNYYTGGTSITGKGKRVIENVNLIIKINSREEVAYELQIYREHAGLIKYDDRDLEIRIGEFRSDLPVVDQKTEGGATRKFLDTGSLADIDSQVIYRFTEDPASHILAAESVAYRYYASGDRAQVILSSQQLANIQDFVRRYDPRFGEDAPAEELPAGAGPQVEAARPEPLPTRQELRLPPAGRERVRWAQERLNGLGYDCGTPDGLAGPRTRGCIQAFQRDRGLAQTGDLNEPTTDAIAAIQ